jgi:elongation factor P--(R)-beta-lysine ligase
MSKVHTREDFLKTHWRRYPSVPARCYNSDEWRFGRLEHIDSGQLHFKKQTSLPVSPLIDQEIFDAQMGPAIPVAALKSGDVVVAKYIHGQVEAIYLLSPNIDESAQPSSAVAGAASTGKEWQIFLEAVRSFFTQRQFTHWKTPYFVPSSGVDAHIDFYRASGVRTKNSFYLPTSPELELKKAIVKGEERVFEIKSCFRDDDRTAHHRPEFTMLEWYRSFEDKWVLLEDIQELLPYVARGLGLDQAFPKIQRRSIAALFQQYVGLDLSPRTAKQELSSSLTKHGLDQSPTDDWDDLFFRLYIDLIEPQLGMDGPEVIYNFPATQGSLARTNSEGWADRFELYWHGVELANAYQEQNDPFLIEVRVRGEVQKRQRLGREPHAVDEEFIKMMKLGFPPCAGIAMGLDRLFMVLKGHKHV